MTPRRESTRWDYVIVGGGSAGCVLAHRLSQDPRHRVLLLEAGPRDWAPQIHFPAAGLWGSLPMWTLAGEPDASLRGESLRWAGGRVLGGTSSVNGMVWVRGDPREFDAWAEAGCRGWDYASVLPYFKRAESWEEGETAYRGGTGPIATCRQRVRHFLTDAFVAAAREAGFPGNPDYNAERQEGVGYGQVNQRRGFRQSTARTYLGSARGRRNLAVWTRAEVLRILFEGTRAVGVEVERGGRALEARAAKEVVVSAGALGSPLLLMRSGIGPAAGLARHGIAVVADLRGVGENLQEHVVVTTVWDVNVPTLNRDLRPLPMLKHGLDFLLRGRGAIAAGLDHAMLFATLDPAVRHSQIETWFAPFVVRAGQATEILGRQGASRLVLGRRDQVMACTTLVHPRCRGRVALRSARREDPPVVELALLADPSDVDDLVRGSRAIDRIFRQPSFRRYAVGRCEPAPEVLSDAAWAEHVRGTARSGLHAVGTCAMGAAGDTAAVVDPELRVRGVAALRVIDASVIPRIPCGNTNAPTIMVAERGADRILQARAG